MEAMVMMEVDRFGVLSNQHWLDPFFLEISIHHYLFIEALRCSIARLITAHSPLEV